MVTVIDLISERIRTADRQGEPRMSMASIRPSPRQVAEAARRIRRLRQTRAVAALGLAMAPSAMSFSLWYFEFGSCSTPPNGRWR
jgi:hypothetical protein